MKLPLILATCQFLTIIAFSQTPPAYHKKVNSLRPTKPAIQINDVKMWPNTDQAGISNDGRFAYYYVENSDLSSLVLESTDGKWKNEIKIVGLSQISFSRNCKFATFVDANDSLYVWTLGSSNFKSFAHANAFQLSNTAGDEWISFIKTDSSHSLRLYNLSTALNLDFNSVSLYNFFNSGKDLIYISNCQYSGKIGRAIYKYSFKTKKTIQIWSGGSATNFAFNGNATQFAFTAIDLRSSQTFIYTYDRDDSTANLCVGKTFFDLDSNLTILEGPLKYSSDDKHILFSVLHNKKNRLREDSNAFINVWSYTDKYLQSDQENSDPQFEELVIPIITSAVVNLSSGQVLLLNKENEILNSTNNFDEVVTISPALNNTAHTSSIIRNENQPFRILNVFSGKVIYKSATANYDDLTISPSGRDVVWFDKNDSNYWSYSLSTGRVGNLSAAIPTKRLSADSIDADTRFLIAGWGETDNSIFIYDEFDIWKIDLDDSKRLTNLTNFTGRKDKIVFSFLNSNENDSRIMVNLAKPVVLAAFEKETKNNGFYLINEVHGSGPKKLFMSQECFVIPRSGTIGVEDYPPGTMPIKAKSSTRYLLRIMSAKKYPNWYITDNFKSFKQLSFIEPEKNFNWLSSKLCQWTLPSGKVAKGILYIPENLDSSQKYPIIFNYYERRSNELNAYLTPDLSRADLNIPYFVSNGYLIFVPDIYYKSGKNGESVLTSITSAANYLKSFPFIDSTRMGIQGHSFGGWETNFLITHTGRFVAACEASGVSDQISAYDALDGWGRSRQRFYEEYSQGSPYGIDVTPWTGTAQYIENSPVLFVNRITTPLLMMHGAEDRAVPFSQALEMFLAMRRASKRVWLLEYTHAGHVLWNNRDAEDFTVRMRQFFDVYLKLANPPKWMTGGIAPRNRLSNTSLDIDTSKTIIP